MKKQFKKFNHMKKKISMCPLNILRLTTHIKNVREDLQVHPVEAYVETQ